MLGCFLFKKNYHERAEWVLKRHIMYICFIDVNLYQSWFAVNSLDQIWMLFCVFATKVNDFSFREINLSGGD